jgi:probable HAF family extracellular repeat protein
LHQNHKDNVFTSFSVPAASFNSTAAFGINNTGEIVGTFNDSSLVPHAFLDNNGVVTMIDVPGGAFPVPQGINDIGQIVGSFQSPQAVTLGFLDTNGVFTTIDVPGSALSIVLGINNAGQMVGEFANSAGTHGFLDAHGVFNTINVPEAIDTQADAINNAGQIVGTYTDSNFVQHAFLYNNGVFTTINFLGPSGISTYANGINDRGQIVGGYMDALSLTGQGFVATPTPEPDSLLLAGFGLAAITTVMAGRRSPRQTVLAVSLTAALTDRIISYPLTR